MSSSWFKSNAHWSLIRTKVNCMSCVCCLPVTQWNFHYWKFCWRRVHHWNNVMDRIWKNIEIDCWKCWTLRLKIIFGLRLPGLSCGESQWSWAEFTSVSYCKPKEGLRFTVEASNDLWPVRNTVNVICQASLNDWPLAGWNDEGRPEGKDHSARLIGDWSVFAAMISGSSSTSIDVISQQFNSILHCFALCIQFGLGVV